MKTRQLQIDQQRCDLAIALCHVIAGFWNDIDMEWNKKQPDHKWMGKQNQKDITNLLKHDRIGSGIKDEKVLTVTKIGIFCDLILAVRKIGCPG